MGLVSLGKVDKDRLDHFSLSLVLIVHFSKGPSTSIRM